MGRKMPLVVLLLDDITDKLRYAQAVWLSYVTHDGKKNASGCITFG